MPTEGLTWLKIHMHQGKKEIKLSCLMNKDDPKVNPMPVAIEIKRSCFSPTS